MCNWSPIVISTAMIGVFTAIAIAILLFLHWRFRRAERGAEVFGSIGNVLAAAILAFGALFTTDRVIGLFGNQPQKELRKTYETVFGDAVDDRWVLIVATPPVLKGVTESEDSRLQAMTSKSEAGKRPVVLTVPPCDRFPYRNVILSTDQYVGGGEAAGCFFFSGLFERMGIRLDMEWRRVEEPPVGPAIILGSKNVTAAKPELFGVRWYVESGHIYERGEPGWRKKWTAEYDSLINVVVDYGILSKVLSPQGHTLVVCEGIHSYGTYGVVWEFMHSFDWMKSQLERENHGQRLESHQQFQVVFRFPVYGSKPKNGEIIAVRVW